jgi:hypothetical protein
MPLSILSATRTRHHEAIDWASRVVTAGGTVSVRTLDAVSRFCRDIETAGIRGKFYRLNLVCGNFTAALVPLYLNTSFAGSVLGNTTDTNANFVSGDYVETGTSTGGLKGNGSTKYLNTGLNPVTISASVTDSHLAAYVSGTEAASASRYIISNTNLGTGGPGLGWLNGGSRERYHTPSVFIDGATTGKDGFLAGSIGSSASAYYQNGTSLAAGAAGSGSFTNRSIFVMASNTGTAALLFSLARYLRAYSIGLNMTSTQWSDYNTAMQNFQTAMDRKV